MASMSPTSRAAAADAAGGSDPAAGKAQQPDGGGERAGDDACSESGSKSEGPREGDEGDEGDDGDDAEKSADDDVDWEDYYACPLTVRFTQEKIHPFFYRRGPIVNVVPKIRLVVRTPGSNEQMSVIPGDSGPDGDIYELVPPFAPIHCLRKGEELWALDNRRLYALQLAAMEQWPVRCRVRLLCSDRLPRRKLKTQWRKFQTTNEGRGVLVTARFQQFDTWSWFDRAVELEWYYFSQRLGTLLNVFEMLPVVGALLFRTGVTGYRTRVPFIVAFAVTFCIDFLRHKLPVFERRISELHVKATMDGELRELPCQRRRESGESMMSAPQLAATMVVVLLLLLPYLHGLAFEKLRSSLFSCWLGVACVLAVQMGMILRRKSAAEIEYSGCNQKLHPKHRD